MREALTVEVFVGLNATWRGLEGYTERMSLDAPTFREALSRVQRGILSTVGAIDHTLTRDQGWLFLKLGEAIERAVRTATVLHTKLLALLAPEPANSISLWSTRACARCCAGSPRSRTIARLSARAWSPRTCSGFLLFATDAPRSIRYGTAAVKSQLERLTAGAPLVPACRIIGRLDADLAYRDEGMSGRIDPLPLLDHVLAELIRTHDALSVQFFEG